MSHGGARNSATARRYPFTIDRRLKISPHFLEKEKPKFFFSLGSALVPQSFAHIHYPIHLSNFLAMYPRYHLHSVLLVNCCTALYLE